MADKKTDKVYVFASRYDSLMVTWPLGSEQTIRFHNGRYTTPDESCAKHLRTLRNVVELPQEAATSKRGERQLPETQNTLAFLEECVKAKIVKKDRGWYKYGEDVIGNRYDMCDAFFQKRPDVKDALIEVLASVTTEEPATGGGGTNDPATGGGGTGN